MIKEASGDDIAVAFETQGLKKLKTMSCVDGCLFSFKDKGLQEVFLQNQEILKRSAQIEKNVRWAERDFAPYAEFLD